MLQKLHLYQNLFQPFMIVTHGHTFASKVAQRDTIKHMLYQKHNTLPASTQLRFLDKELFEISLTKRRRRYTLRRLRGWLYVW
jgi:hypothetical protein